MAGGSLTARDRFMNIKVNLGRASSEAEYKDMPEEESGGNSALVFLRVTEPEGVLPAFSLFLQRGFFIRIAAGCSLQTLLCGHFGLDSAYVEQRIKTIFLNGFPVDDPAAAFVESGSTLALSGALPGLAGATLRRGSPLAGMRSSEPRSDGAYASSMKPGFVQVKIFNLLIPELGPNFLRKGIYLTRKEWNEFLNKMAPAPIS